MVWIRCGDCCLQWHARRWTMWWRWHALRCCCCPDCCCAGHARRWTVWPWCALRCCCCDCCLQRDPPRWTMWRWRALRCCCSCCCVRFFSAGRCSAPDPSTRDAFDPSRLRPSDVLCVCWWVSRVCCWCGRRRSRRADRRPGDDGMREGREEGGEGEGRRRTVRDATRRATAIRRASKCGGWISRDARGRGRGGGGGTGRESGKRDVGCCGRGGERDGG